MIRLNRGTSWVIPDFESPGNVYALLFKKH
jgi:hypothetical protein